MPGKKVKLIAVVLAIALVLSSVAISNNIYAQAKSLSRSSGGSLVEN